MDGKEKVYSKKPIYPKANLELGTFEEPAGPGGSRAGENPAMDLLKKADQLILAQHSPPAVVVDQDLKVLQFRGRTSEFLEHNAGEPSLNLGKMTRGGLALEIRKLIQSARKTGNTVTSKPMPSGPDHGGRTIRLSVTPIRGLSARETAYLVLFEGLQTTSSARPDKGGGKKGKPLPHGAAAQRIQDLEAELAATKQYLQSVVQEQEAAVEELKSAHEEVQSSNEELQSTNEELLTSKEELQSSNEELNTVNEEMQGRNAELQQSNDDLNNLLGSTNIPIVMLGNDLRIRRVTAQAEKVLGLLPTDVGRKVTDFRIKINCPDLETLFIDVVENLHSKDREVQDEDNRTWLMNIRPYRTLDNKIDGAVMTLYDVTERRQAAEVRYRRLFETAHDGIILCLAESGEIVDVNPFVVRLFGFPRVELIGKKIWESGPFAGSAVNSSSFSRLQSGEPLRSTFSLHAVSGEQIAVEVVANAYGEGARHVVQFNIRQQVPPETDENGHAGKLEAVGRLAGGLAHEFNNALTAILGYCDVMLDRAGSDAALRDEIEHVRRAGEGASAITRRLLAFGRREKSQAAVIDFSAVVAEMEQVLRVVLPENIELVMRAGELVGNIRIDRAQLEQMITNLALNSRDAMPDGGRLTIETSRQKLDEAFCREHPSVSPGDYASLLVSDTGAGMTLETQSHLFEPFFTTKPRGSGSGLGLALVDRFVREAGGCVMASSEFGRGTIFRIFLPHVDDTAQKAEIQPAALVRGTGSILLVEDDPAVRRVTKSILERCGYRVTDAPGGPEALRALPERDGLDLLVTDVVMPRMSGRELADRILAGRPGVRVLYMSAHADDVLEPHGLLNGAFTVMRKPFAPAALSQKISELLQQKK
jgi:two-component system CheB/CheR fusion protein